MQHRDISSIEFHKVLQEVEKCHKPKADISKEPKAKVKVITKKSDKNYLNKEEKKTRKTFYEKSQILQLPRVSMPFKI